MAKNVSTAIQIDVLQEMRTPLRYFALAVLVVNGILGALAYKATGLDFSILLIGMIVSLILLIFIVGYLVVKNPRALVGVDHDGIPSCL